MCALAQKAALLLLGACLLSVVSADESKHVVSTMILLVLKGAPLPFSATLLTVWRIHSNNEMFSNCSISLARR